MPSLVQGKKFIRWAAAIVLSLASPALAADLKDPPGNGFLVVKSDTFTIPATTALYVGVTGDIQVTFEGGGPAVVLKAVPVGLLQIRVTQIWSTNTTATNILALYP